MGRMCSTSSPARGMSHSTPRAAIGSDRKDFSQLKGWKRFVAVWKQLEGSGDTTAVGPRQRCRHSGRAAPSCSRLLPANQSRHPRLLPLLYHPRYFLIFLDAKGTHLETRPRIPLDLAVPPAFNHSFSIDPFAGISLPQLPASVSPNARPRTTVPTRTALSCPHYQSAFPPVGPSGPQQHLTTLLFLAW